MANKQRIRSNSDGRSVHIQYQPIFATNSTLWAACRAVVFGTIVIVVGMLMTVVGYFDVDLAKEERYNEETGQKEIVINLSKRYQLKSLQYVGPVLMGIGSFILIIACVITLESRDKHAQIIHEESKEFRKKQNACLQTEDCVAGVHSGVRITTEEIRNWEPKYLQLPRIDSNDSKLSTERKFSSTSCIPQLLQTTDARRLYDRLMEDYYNEVYREIPKNAPEQDDSSLLRNGTSCKHESTKQSIIAEIHIPPCSSLSSSNSVFSSPLLSRRGQATPPAEGSHKHTFSTVVAVTPPTNHAETVFDRIESATTVRQSDAKQAAVRQNVVRQASPVDLHFTENVPSAVLKLAHPKVTPAAVAGQRNAPIAQIDVDLRSSSSCSSPDTPNATSAVVCQHSATATAEVCNLPNGMEIR
ncbi:hypothetical protein Tcan_06287 [Toxocara canis]|uniref:Transmembrane protein n=1 Tax=Toxocara canis TaxID=6265 RepID=A0A0B2UR80_TOXCA|nr:hypothetical protein Tcan_06287 [Toxocara canis]